MFPLTPAGRAVSSTLSVDRSLRFRSSATASISRTPSVAGNRQKFTFSTWLKPGGTVSSCLLESCVNGVGTDLDILYFNASNKLQFTTIVGGTTIGDLTTDMVFRDYSAWYHVILSVDTTQATAANRVTVYVNGVIASLTGTIFAQNTNTNISRTISHFLCRRALSTAIPFDTLLAETNFIDGSALTATSFGAYDATTGVWQPKKYTGSYGTNGFYLNYSDNSGLTTSSNTGLGKDFSGNGNFFATNNISLTAGPTYDSFTDVPVLTSATASNYSVINPLRNSGVISETNLGYTSAASTLVTALCSIPIPSSAKIYFEVDYQVGPPSGSYTCVGVATPDISLSSQVGMVANSWSVESNQQIDAYKRSEGTSTSYGAGTAFATGNVCMVAVDRVNGKIWYGRNGAWLSGGSPAAGTSPDVTGVSTALELFPAMSAYGGSGKMAINFGQRPFAYTPPTGFLALNAFNLPTPSIVKPNTQFDATLYTGNGSTQSVVNAGAFQPDLVWIKDRTSITNHKLTDSVRGVQKALSSNLQSADSTDTTGLTAFNSNGFTIGANADYNTSTDSQVAWQWKKGATPGFDVVTYTGTGATMDVSHSLGVAPKMIIVKNRSSATSWNVYHAFANGGSNPKTTLLLLDSNAAQSTGVSTWGSSSPTSSTFKVGATGGVNTVGNLYVAYLWSEIPGFSKFGAYLGTGAEGAFVYCGFRPKFILAKAYDWTNGWAIVDGSRSPINLANLALEPSGTSADLAQEPVDFLSNGFKPRGTGTRINGNGNNMIYAAFAENPFKYALAR